MRIAPSSQHGSPPSPSWPVVSRRDQVIVTRLAGAAAVVFVTASVLVAQEAEPYQPLVKRYASMVRAVQLGSPRRTLERVFDLTRELQRVLVVQPNAPLDLMPEAEYDRLRRDLPGMIVEREPGGGGMLIVRADAEWFLKTARTHGDAADRAFFVAYRRMYPNGVWPSYVQQQTDEAGCTDFEGGRLLALYETWRRFARTHPGRYVRATAVITDDLEREFSKSTCACGGAQSIERELSAFVRRFPRSPAAPAARMRLRELRAGTSPIRLHCVAG